MVPHVHADLSRLEIPQHRSRRAEFRELLEDQGDQTARLLVRLSL